MHQKHLIDCVILNYNVNAVSSEFNVSYGVNQCGVLSETLFAIYIDELFDTLNRSRYGCHIGNTYMGAFGYMPMMTHCSVIVRSKTHA